MAHNTHSPWHKSSILFRFSLFDLALFFVDDMHPKTVLLLKVVLNILGAIQVKIK